MNSRDFTKNEIIGIRDEIKNNFAQKPSSNDRMLDLEDEISTFGDEIEKRNEFTRDRDRIIYTTSFRRLEHKAQVYSHEKGDHYRTRLTHTLEVMQIARGISRNLGLCEDLTEAIALAHDIGHTPFGHAGEEVLDGIMRGNDDLGGKLKYEMDYGGFKHNFHSLKILDVIERKYEDEKGLNLTWQVLDGILKHTKIKKQDKVTKKNKYWDLSRFVKNDTFFETLAPKYAFSKNIIKKKEFENKYGLKEYGALESKISNLETPINLESPEREHSLTLEGQVVNIADEIAQRQHDLDDGLRDEALRMNELDVLLDTEKIIDTVLGEIISKKIVLENDNITFYPMIFLFTGLNDIIDKLRNELLKFKLLKADLGAINRFEEEFINKILRNILPVDIIIDIFKEDYIGYLDYDIELLLKLKHKIHKSEIKKDNFKWKNRIRNVVSYFIHDICYNTMINIKERNAIFRDKYHREENLKYLKSKKNFNDSLDLKKDDRLINTRKYVLDQYVSLSETAKRFNDRIDQYIEKRIINSYNVNRFDGKAKFIIRQLFKAYYENPKQMKKAQLNYLSDLIKENIDMYYSELSFRDGTKIRDIKFCSNNPEFVLNLSDVNRLIALLKLDVLLEDLNNPDINFLNDPNENYEFLKGIGGKTDKIDKKLDYLDDEAKNKLIFNEILQRVNKMDMYTILNEDNEKHKKILFIKCLIEIHYSYLSIICDYIAGMTDNYAKMEYEKLYLV